MKGLGFFAEKKQKTILGEHISTALTQQQVGEQCSPISKNFPKF
jgi:hypothetical protein